MTDQNIMHNTKNPRQGGGCTWRGSLLGGEEPNKEDGSVQDPGWRVPSYTVLCQPMTSHGVSWRLMSTLPH